MGDAPHSDIAKAARWRWAIAVGLGLAIAAAPAPSGVAVESWRLFAVFAATIAGLIAQPAPGGFVVLLGITAIALFGIMPIQKALAGYADPIVWLVLAACLMSRGMIKTGLGRRIAYVFIRAIGHRTLGLGYALVGSQVVLASFIPSTGARCGGIVFPIARSLGQAYGSEAGPTARRLGRVPDGASLPVRGAGLRHLPHGPGLERAHGPSRPAGRGLRADLRPLAPGRPRAGAALAGARTSPAVPASSPRR